MTYLSKTLVSKDEAKIHKQFEDWCALAVSVAYKGRLRLALFILGKASEWRTHHLSKLHDVEPI